jgi:hypothetical protein
MSRTLTKCLLPLIQAYADGAVIQGRNRNFPDDPSCDWHDVDNPAWYNEDMDWRIKPKLREWWIDVRSGLVVSKSNAPIMSHADTVHVREVLE